MAESMKPVAGVGVVDTYAGPYSFHGIEYMPKGQWELFTAAQLEQAIEPYKKAADSLSKYVLCQKERYFNGDIYCSCCGEKLDGYHTHKDWCVVAEAEKYATLFAKEGYNDN